MIHLRSAVLVFGVSALVIAASAAGCSSEQPGGGGGTSGISSGSSSGTSSSTSGGEGGTDGGSSGQDAESFGPETCNVKQLGEEVAEIASPGPVPTPLGGTVATGTYVLTEFRVYGEPLEDGGEGAAERYTGVMAKKTLHIAGNLVSSIGATSAPNQALPADQASAFVFAVKGLSLETTGVCPDKATKTIGFSAVGGGLALYPDGKHRELYLKQ